MTHPTPGRSRALAGVRALPRRFTSFRAVLPAALITLAAGPLNAQGGGIFVRVTSPDGPVAGASVDLLVADSVVTSGVSDDLGVARLVGLAPATYVVRVEAVGYHRKTSEPVVVGPGESKVVDLLLAVAPVQLEGIRAVTDRVQIQRQNTDFSTTVDEVAIESLPLAYASAEVVALTPGARPGHVWGGANFQANSYTLDGLSINHPGMGGDLVEPSMNWIARVEVKGLGAGADVGGFQGGLVNVVTRSGDNDFGGMIRSTTENDALNASNLVSTEIGRELATRYDVEGQVHGPIVRDRLFYFLSGQRIGRTSRVLNHVYGVDARYSPLQERWTEHKLFGKLSWTPGQAGLVELTGGYLDARAENYGLNGYEADGAAHRYSAPTIFAGVRWNQALSTWGSLDARVNHFTRDERSEAYRGTSVPGIRAFALTPPYSAYGNEPFTYRSAPSSTSAGVTATFRLPAGEHEHLVKVGGEVTRGGFLDRRIRNGGMTWMPPRRLALNASDPSTWSFPTTNFIPTQWGGDVHLDADVVNAAAFVQSSLSLGSRVVLSPGLRLGVWKGWLTPRRGPRFLAVEDAALDPRVGLTVELDREGSLVLKGHWGRYHQNMIAQMFDRAEGADAFTNEEFWWYRGPAFTDPTLTFTEAQRDSLAALGQFTREGTVVLNQTGPVGGYRQPYIDQWLVGVEKQFGSSVKFEALYTRRANHDMIALVDRNRDSNYAVFRNVRVYDAGGTPIAFEGGTVVLDSLYVPNYVVVERLKLCASDPSICGQISGMPPGYTFADTLTLTWDPDYALTSAPDARREFGQVQLTFEISRPRWGGSLSAVFTDLRGNLDNVSGYSDPSQYGAGPYVRVNEHVNSFGLLPNFSQREAKASVWGLLPWDVRGGLVFTYSSGDHFSPTFRLSGLGFYSYRANAVAQENPNTYCRFGGYIVVCDNVDWRLVSSVEGQDVYVGPRGQPHLKSRANFDIRLNRTFELNHLGVAVSLDLFNVFGQDTPTEVNARVNHGRNFYYFLQDRATTIPGAGIPPNQYYKAILDRVSARTLRLGMTVEF